MSLPYADISSLNIVQADKRHDDWFMTSYERNVLVALANSIQAKIMIETGVQVGNAAFEILIGVPTIDKYIGIDVLPGYIPSMVEQKDEVPSNPGYLVNNNPRFELALRPRGSLDFHMLDLPMCDMFLIDGDHGREAVIYDTYLATHLVRRGGIILWHDYHDDATVDVKRVLDKMDRDIRHIKDTWLAIERVP